MPERIIVYWRDIPAQVLVKAGRNRATRELPIRFAEAIDRCAMRTGAHGTDDYLNAWRRSEPVPCGDDLDGEAHAFATELDGTYDQGRLNFLVDNGGFDAEGNA